MNYIDWRVNKCDFHSIKSICVLTVSEHSENSQKVTILIPTYFFKIVASIFMQYSSTMHNFHLGHMLQLMSVKYG